MIVECPISFAQHLQTHKTPEMMPGASVSRCWPSLENEFESGSSSASFLPPHECHSGTSTNAVESCPPVKLSHLQRRMRKESFVFSDDCAEPCLE